MRLWFFVVCALAVAGSPLPAEAAQLAGIAVEVDPNAVAALDNVPRGLEDGSDLFMGEQVVTTASGQVQIIFNDNTKMVVGPNSSLLIEEYLLRNDQTLSRFTINALGGTYRFITGDSDHNVYEIKTPTGTIGVRGTAFDFDVDPVTFEVHLLLYWGGVGMCGASCIEMVAACSLGVMGSSLQPG
ncbi:MAG: FecR domain-containing protein, partial [Cucumibacter sp.]